MVMLRPARRGKGVKPDNGLVGVLSFFEDEEVVVFKFGDLLEVAVVKTGVEARLGVGGGEDIVLLFGYLTRRSG